MKKYKFIINGNKYSVDIDKIEDNKAQIEVNGTPYSVEMEMSEMENMPKAPKTVVKIAAPAAPKAAAATATVATAPTANSGGSVIKSPLPGTILDVFVREGDTVKAGQHLLLLEAMKMENNIDADKEGVVKSIKVNRGNSVMEGDPLIIIG